MPTAGGRKVTVGSARNRQAGNCHNLTIFPVSNLHHLQLPSPFMSDSTSTSASSPVLSSREALWHSDPTIAIAAAKELARHAKKDRVELLLERLESDTPVSAELLDSACAGLCEAPATTVGIVARRLATAESPETVRRFSHLLLSVFTRTEGHVFLEIPSAFLRLLEERLPKGTAACEAALVGLLACAARTSVNEANALLWAVLEAATAEPAPSPVAIEAALSLLRSSSAPAQSVRLMNLANAVGPGHPVYQAIRESGRHG